MLDFCILQTFVAFHRGIVKINGMTASLGKIHAESFSSLTVAHMLVECYFSWNWGCTISCLVPYSLSIRGPAVCVQRAW
jgi:hypothetical protein